MLAKSPKTQSLATCYHCGDRCATEVHEKDFKSFCCKGCLTVYEILHENGLDDYYELERYPGTKLKPETNLSRFDYLENERIKDQLLDFSSTNLDKINLSLPAIHCSSCIWLLENLALLQSGVIRSQVDFTKKKARIDFNPQKVSLKQLVQLLSSLGYEPDISLSQETNEKMNAADQSLLIKLGVAGFSFGNIMLLSFPEYLGLQHLPSLSKVITYLNLLLVFPVVFYSAADYFKSAYYGLRHRWLNIDVPIALGITALFGRSIYEIVSRVGPGYFDSLAGLVFLLLIGKWLQNRTYQHLSFDRDYRSYFPLAATRLTDEESESVLVRELRKGDRILVRHQELIPADSILISDNSAIDYSFVSGEAHPVFKNRGDLIYAGGRQAGASIELQVQKSVSQSYLTQLWDQQTFKKNTHSAQSLINQISKYFTPAVIGIAVLTGMYWWGQDQGTAFKAIVAVLIVACPCALAMATPFTLGNTLSVFGKHHFYLKNISVVEALNRINYLVFDKTGTITQNGANKVHYVGQKLSQNTKSLVAGLCSHSTHPLSQQITGYLNLSNNRSLEVEGFQEIAGQGISGMIANQLLRMGSFQFVTDQPPQSIDFNKSRVYLTINDDLKGHFEIDQQYRAGLKSLLNALASKFSLAMISGDGSGEKENLRRLFPSKARMAFKQSPFQKLECIKEL
ncbi:MAG: heavy metal translocating P-type ATPase, partial [Cyclobacteriaceae bacterium]